MPKRNDCCISLAKFQTAHVGTVNSHFYGDLGLAHTYRYPQTAGIVTNQFLHVFGHASIQTDVAF